MLPISKTWGICKKLKIELFSAFSITGLGLSFLGCARTVITLLSILQLLKNVAITSSPVFFMFEIPCFLKNSLSSCFYEFGEVEDIHVCIQSTIFNKKSM